MKRFVAGVVIGMVLAGGVAYAQTPPIMSGQAFLDTWRDDWRAMYTVGWYKGYITAAAGLDFPSTVRRVTDCLANWTMGQTQAIIERYVRANPQAWHEDIMMLSVRAVLRACP